MSHLTQSSEPSSGLSCEAIARKLADVGEPGAGPVLITVAGLHGNEPSGVEAVARVRERLASAEWSLRGQWVALSGNRAALGRGVRYVDRDLNRVWPGDEASLEPIDGVEGRERTELLDAIRAICDAGGAPVAFLDLHSTSAGGPPFLIMGDTLQNRAVARRLPIPTILGLEENVDGTLVEFLCEQGYISICIEAGAHDDPVSIDHAESTIWLALAALGMLPDAAAEWAREHRDRLERVTAGIPHLVEIVHRHGLPREHRFRMEPDFANFQLVGPGELVAHDGDAEVRAPRRGLMLMPLYQPLGDDGYFLVRGVRPVWLALSKWLRRVRGERILRWLPGVRVDPRTPRRLIVDRRVARYLSREIFHLFGFHRVEERGAHVVFRRRHEGRANSRGTLRPPGDLPRERREGSA